MPQVWVKYDLNWVGDRTDGTSAADYMTSISGYSVRVYIPWAQPWLWPDTPEEFIITPAQSSHLGGVSGYYLPISTVAAGSYYKSGGGTASFPYHTEYPFFTATAVAISLTQPNEPTPQILVETRYDDFSKVERSWAILDYVWRLAYVEGPSAPPLFSSADDDVSFNNLSAAQIDTIKNSSTSQMYNALAGNDNVTLPDKVRLSSAATVQWETSRTFFGGDGNDTIRGGKLNDRISGGSGDDVIYSGAGTRNDVYGAGYNHGMVDGVSQVETGFNKITAQSLTYIHYQDVRSAYDIEVFRFWDTLTKAPAGATNNAPFVWISPDGASSNEDSIFGSDKTVKFLFAGTEYSGASIRNAAAASYAIESVEAILELSVIAATIVGGPAGLAGAGATLLVWKAFSAAVQVGLADDPNRARETFIQVGSLAAESITDFLGGYLKKQVASKENHFHFDYALELFVEEIPAWLETLWGELIADPTTYYDAANPVDVTDAFATHTKAGMSQLIDSVRSRLEQEGLLIQQRQQSPMPNPVDALLKIGSDIITPPANQPLNINLSKLGLDLPGPVIMGGEFGDSVVGPKTQSIFFMGQGGNDKITGGNGGDKLYGDDGDDILLGGSGDDFLDGGTGDDSIDGGANGSLGDTVSYRHAEAGVAISLLLKKQDTGGAGLDTIKNVENIVGSHFNDLLIGGKGANVIRAGEGADTISGGAGPDQLLGEGGDDLFKISGTEAVGDIIDGGSGNDTLKVVGEGATTLGNTAIENIEFFVGNGRQIVGTSGHDSFNFSLFQQVSSVSFIDGLAGNDTILGAVSEANDLRGSAGIDTLVGGNFADQLYGGAGVDTLTGGGGADTFIFKSSAEGGDIITDFAAGEDKLSISKAGFKLAKGVSFDTGTALDFGLHYFVSNTAGSATEAGHGQFIFNETTNQLLWDADGLGKKAGVLIASFSNDPSLTANDFLLV